MKASGLANLIKHCKVPIFLASLGLLAVVPAPVQAQVVPPHILLGGASVDGVTVADGSRISAWSGGDRLASSSVTDGSYRLQVPRPPSGQKTLTFTVGPFVAAQTMVWEIGGASVLELGASKDLSLLVLALEPLGDNLERVFYFDSATESWVYYDPRAEFNNNSLTRLRAGEGYWLQVTRSETVLLNGQGRQLEAGANYIIW